ncbi:hypothetical protein ABZX72_29375 [Streptomyces cyaneofuscatus]|uniref:hypothetical protein n=1 Tax=Streptomyces cyaneofuscatus TaxID=66883 RepID=UPI0033A018BC
MPEWLPLVLLAVFLAAAVHRLAAAIGSRRRYLSAPPAPERAEDRVLWAACHNIRCGAHNRTVHRATAAGLVCTGCGQLADPAP